MRKRSGGLHCQTQQQFIELAQLSQQKCGLYYDDQLNRKKSELSRNRNKQNKKSQAEKQKKSKPKVFIDFDYNEDDIQEKEMKAELIRSSQKHLSTNIIVICASPEFERLELERILAENATSNDFEEGMNFISDKQSPINKIIYTKDISQQRLIDLHIYKIFNQAEDTYTAYKFWFVKINSINPSICTTYLNMSTQLFRINRNNDEKNNINHLKQHFSQQGKRHAIRDVTDCTQILQNITNARDFSFAQRRPSQVSLFSPHYVSNEEEFFQVWNNDQFFDRKR